MSRNSRIVYITGALLVLLSVLYIYIFDPFTELTLDTPTGMGDFRDRGYYKINPEMILSDLESGKTEVYEVEIATPQSPLFDEPISWHQSDYLRISNSLQEFVWHESLDDWSLYYMDFSTICHDRLSGFGFGEFYYFKTSFLDNGKIRYIARGLQITPQYGDVAWGGRISFPRSLSGWKSIDLSDIKIVAEQALKIAEYNGGKTARLSVHNECKIDVRLSGYTGWEVVMYEIDTGSPIFRMEIDPYSGEIK